MSRTFLTRPLRSFDVYYYTSVFSVSHPLHFPAAVYVKSFLHV